MKHLVFCFVDEFYKKNTHPKKGNSSAYQRLVEEDLPRIL